MAAPEVVGQRPGNDDASPDSHADDQNLPAGGPATDLPILRESYQQRTAPRPQGGPEVDEEEAECDHVPTSLSSHRN